MCHSLERDHDTEVYWFSFADMKAGAGKLMPPSLGSGKEEVGGRSAGRPMDKQVSRQWKAGLGSGTILNARYSQYPIPVPWKLREVPV